MAKRKKIKNAGSTTRNIHKIATTIGIVPLVAMSSFMFQDSNALAAVAPEKHLIPSLHNVTIDLNLYPFASINASYLFGEGSGYSLTAPVVSLSSSNALTATFGFGSGGAVNIKGYSPGTYTVTVDVQGGSYTNEYTTFKVVVIDQAVTVNALDTNHNGFDVGDIVAAYSSIPQNPAADLNGDGVVDDTDISKLLTFLPSYANHNPTLTGNSTSLPPVTLDSLDTYQYMDNNFFTDLDGDSLTYKIYKDEDSAEAPYFSLDTYFTEDQPQLRFRATRVGSTTFTIVANDGHGGSKAATIAVNVAPSANPAPEIKDPLLDELIFTNHSFLSLSELFYDTDPMYYSVANSSGNQGVSLSTSPATRLIAAGSGSQTITIKANDSKHMAPTQRTLVARILDDNEFLADGVPNHSLKLADFFAEGSTITQFEPMDFGYEDEGGYVKEASVSLNQTAGSMGEIVVTGYFPTTITFDVEATRNSIKVHKKFIIEINESEEPEGPGIPELPPFPEFPPL